MASKTIEFDAVVSANQINRLLADLRSGAEGAAKAINDALGGTVTKKIVFEEVVNGNGVKQLVAVEKERLTIADQLISKQRQLDKTQQGSKTNLQQTLNTLRQQRDGVARYQTSINAVGQSIRVQRQEWTELNTRVSTVARQLDIASASGFWDQLKVSTNTQGLINIGNGLVQITNQLQAASIVVGQFVGAINGLIDAAAQIQSFNLAFQAISAGAAGGAKALQESSRLALGLGVDLNTVQEGFKQLSPVVLNIGGTLGDVSDVVESLSSRFAAFGISGDRARRVTQGVIQAFAKGKLQAEELTQQISEADPAFKTDFASALFAARSELGALGKQVDGSTANLEKLVKAGKITAGVLLKVIPGISKSGFLFGKLGPTAGTAVDALEKGSVTIDQVRSNLKNLNQLSLRDLAKSAEPLINAFLRVQAVVVDFFSRITKSSAFEAFAAIAARIVEALGRLADVFFVAIEGALKFAEAVKPILDLFINIPGLVEIAGVALLGKLLGPLKLLDGKLGKVGVTWNNFINTISGSPREAVTSVTNSIKGLQAQLLKPVKINVDTTGIARGVAAIGSTLATEAGNVAGKTVDQIDRKIEQSLKTQARLRQQITEAESSPSGKIGESVQLNKEYAALKTTLKEITRQENDIKKQIKERGADARGIGTGTLADDLEANQTAWQKTYALAVKVKQAQLEIANNPVFTEKDINRINRYKSQLQASLAVTAGLREERIRAEGASSAARRQQVGFDPSIINQQQKYINLRREEIKQDILSKSTSFQALNAREKAVRERLAAIERERKNLSQAFPVLKPRAGEFRTDEVRKLRDELRSLTEEKGRFSAVADQASIGATDFARILKEGSSESSTFTQRQTALAASLDLSRTIVKQNATELKALRVRYREVAAEGRALEKQQRDRPFTGAVPTNDPLRLAIAENKGQRARIKREIDSIARSSREALVVQRGLADALAENAKTAPLFTRLGTAIKSFSGGIRDSFVALRREGLPVIATAFGASFAKSSPILANFGKAGIGGITKALGPLKSGLAAIIGLIDPLLAAFIAFGIAARLYADGNKEAAQTAKDFKQTLDNLAATRKDILPGVAAPEKAETALDRAYSNITANTVSFVDGVNAKLKELGNGFFGFFENIREGVPELKSGFVEVIASIALVSGAVVVGAKTALAVVGAAAAAGAATGAATGAAAGAVTGPGAAITAFTGAVIGATIAVAGLVAVTGDAAESKFEQLKKSLGELKTGAAATAEAIDSLSAGLLSDIELKTTGEISPENINRIKSALEAAKEVRNQIQNSLDAVAGRRQKGGEQVDQLEREVKLEEEKLAQIRKQKEELQQVAKGPRGSVSPGDAAKLRELESEERRLADSIENKNGKIKITQRANGELEITIKSLSSNLKTAADNVDKLGAKLTSAQINNIKYANTIGEINTAIKDLTEQNEGLKLNDPEDRKTLDDNLTKIKGFQAILGQISKTKYEVQIEVQNLRGVIAEAQTRIDIEPGDLRDTVTLARKTSDEISNAQNEFQQTIEGLEKLGNLENIAPEAGARAIEEAAMKFLGATREGVANLVDQRRKLEESLTSAQRSLANLKFSKPEFFSEAELRQNAEQINKVFEEEVKLAGFTPKLSGKTSLEILQQKAAFNETRQEARKLEEVIATIPSALDQITGLLASIAGKEVAALKKAGKDVNKEIDKSRSGLKSTGKSVEQVAKAAPRIGQVFARIGAAGKEVVLYYDNVTGKTEEVTAAQFKALQAADKLAAGGSKVGAGFTDGAKKAIDSVKTVGDRIGQVYGTISAGGKTEVIYFDKLSGQVETVSQAVFDRLNKEKAVTRETQKQNTELDNQIKRFQTVDAQIAEQLSKARQVGAAAAKQSPTQDIQGSLVFFPSTATSEEEANRKMAELAKTVGGNYLKVLAETIRTGGFGFMPEAKLGSIARDVSSYRTALEGVKLAQEQADAAQKRYNDGIASGSGDIISLAAGVRNANEALAQSRIDLQSAEAGFRAASSLAVQLGVDISTVPQVGEFLPTPEELGNALQQWQNYVNGVSTGSQQLQTSASTAQQQWNDYVNSVTTGTQQISRRASTDIFTPLVEAAKNATIQGGEVLQEWGTYVQEVQSGIRSISETSVGNPLTGLTDGANAASQALQGATGSSEEISSNFDDTAGKANEIRNSLLELNGKTIEVFVKGTPLVSPRFSGGPVVGGQEYQVNELGKEGFLSAAGKLSNINAPAYGLWRAPGAGTVIPAHIMDRLNVPQAGIKVNTGGKSVTSNSGIQHIMKTIFAAMSASKTPENAINELTNVQANQAVQIGKLSRVVNKLAEKDWNVNVNVRPSSSASFVDRLNHRL